MSNDTSTKIKILSKVILIIGLLGSLVGCMALASYGLDYVVSALAVLVGGAIITLLISLFIYAFGELLEKVSQIEKYLRNNYEAQEKNQFNGTSKSVENNNTINFTK